jgi:hypothetical protein
MAPDEVRAVILSLPSVEENWSLGSACFKVAAKVSARLDVRTGADDLMLKGVHPGESEILTASDPEVFHAPRHYRDSRVILARIGPLRADQLHALLERRWREIAPRRLVKAWDATNTAEMRSD